MCTLKQTKFAKKNRRRLAAAASRQNEKNNWKMKITQVGRENSNGHVTSASWADGTKEMRSWKCWKWPKKRESPCHRGTVAKKRLAKKLPNCPPKIVDRLVTTASLTDGTNKNCKQKMAKFIGHRHAAAATRKNDKKMSKRYAQVDRSNRSRPMTAPSRTTAMKKMSTWNWPKWRNIRKKKRQIAQKNWKSTGDRRR